MNRLIIIATLLILGVACRRELPVFELKIDGTVEERYSKVAEYFKETFQKVWNDADELLLGNLEDIVWNISYLRG